MTSEKKTKERIFESEAEVLELFKEEGLKIVIYEGVVYDVAEYLGEHPGGGDIIEAELGKNIEEPFEEAEHTKSAKQIFKDLPIVGRMSPSDSTSNDSDSVPKNQLKDNSGGISELRGQEMTSRIQFDYTRGIFWQMLWLDWTFEEYTTFINEPKHLVNPVRNLKIFEFLPLELITMTPWWLIPLFWMPIALWHITQGDATHIHRFVLFCIGIKLWTFLEYVLHRFLFHSEDQWYFIHHSKAYVAHFLVHGIHHAFPNDHYRIVFPPILGLVVYNLIVNCIMAFTLPEYISHPLASGMLFGYVLYDSIHYQLHKANPEEGTMIRQMKKEHMQHHYKNGTVGFGVTSKFWDTVFDTRVT